MSGKMKKALHKFTVIICAAQLTVFTSPLMAQPIPGSGNISNEGQNYNHDIGLALLDVVNQGAQTYLQAQQQAFAAMQQANLYQQLAPRTQFDKYFGCPIPESESAFVQNACQNDITSPMELGTATALQSIADGYADYYSKLSNPAQNSRLPVGLQCLENAKDRALDGMTKKLNDMIEMRAQLEKSQQQFRDDQQQILKDMEDINDELKGQTAERAGDNSNTFRDEMGDECSNILGNVGVNIEQAHKRSGDNGGLLGMLKNMQKPNLDAANFSRDKAGIEGEINDVINQIKADIQRDGVANWGGKPGGSINQAYLTNLFRGKSNFANVVNTTMQVQDGIFQNKLNQLRKDVQDADPSFSIPELDKNFVVDMEDFIRGADAHYRRKFVNECMTGGEGLGLSGRDILQSLYQPTSKNRETKTLRDYRRALDGILKSTGMSFEQKEAEIQALDQAYKGSIKMRFEDTQSRQQENVTAYDYFLQYRKDCETRYNEDDTHAPGGGGIGNRSQSTKTKRAVAALQKMKNEIDNYGEFIASEVNNQLLNCNGAPLKSNSCGPDTINVSGPNFCIPHATQCSSKIKSCFQKIEDSVAIRKQRLDAKANAYNDRVENYVANQEQILQQVRGIVKAQESFITGFFESEAPLDAEGIFIPMPEIDDDIMGLGVRLRGKGNLNFMDEMDKKLDLVQGQIANQKGKLERKLNEHIKNVGDQLDANASRWASLKQRCKQKEDAYRAAVDAQNAQMAKQNAENDQRAGDFCRRFDSLAEVNPGPGCDGSNSPEQLFEDMGEVAGQINPRVGRFLSQYRNVCSSVNNARDDEDSDSSSSDVAPLIEACQRNGNNWSSAYNDIVRNFLSEVDENFERGDGDHLEKFLTAEVDELDENRLSSDIRNTDFPGVAMQIRAMHPDERTASMQPGDTLASRLQQERNQDFNTKLQEAQNIIRRANGEFPNRPQSLRPGQDVGTAFTIGSTNITDPEGIMDMISSTDAIRSLSATQLDQFTRNGRSMMESYRNIANATFDPDRENEAVTRLQERSRALEEEIGPLQAIFNGEADPPTGSALTARNEALNNIPEGTLRQQALALAGNTNEIPEALSEFSAHIQAARTAQSEMTRASESIAEKRAEINNIGTQITAARTAAETEHEAARTAANTAADSVQEALLRLRELDTGDGRRPADDNGNGDGAGDGTDQNSNLCQTLQEGIDNAQGLARHSCTSNNSVDHECLERENERIRTDLKYLPSGMREFNASLASIETVAVGNARQEREWRNIGQQAQGICRGRSTASRNGLFNADAFQNMFNGGAQNNPQLRNSIGVQ